MRLGLTGVPGTGKTTLAQALGRAGWRVVHLNDFARGEGLLSERDEARGSFLVDVDELAERLNRELAGEARPVVVESHFAHEVDVDRVVLLRCDPRVLVARLRARGWAEAKVRENVEAEALDILAQEVLETGLEAAELDVTGLGVEASVVALRAIAEGKPQGLKGDPVGTARWSLESLPWF